MIFSITYEYNIVPYARDFLPEDNVTDKTTRAISTRTAINMVRLVHHISLASMVTYLFYCIFETVLGKEHLGKV